MKIDFLKPENNSETVTTVIHWLNLHNTSTSCWLPWSKSSLVCCWWWCAKFQVPVLIISIFFIYIVCYFEQPCFVICFLPWELTHLMIEWSISDTCEVERFSCCGLKASCCVVCQYQYQTLFSKVALFSNNFRGEVILKQNFYQ